MTNPNGAPQMSEDSAASQVGAEVAASGQAAGLNIEAPSSQTAIPDVASSQAGLAIASSRFGGPAVEAAPTAPIAPEQAEDWGEATLQGMGVAAPEVAAPGTDANKDRYAHLLDPNYEPPQASEQVARFDPSDPKLPPAQTSHRPGYWTPPTDAQIARAANSGFDLSQQEKYYTPQQWANRNNK